MRDETQLLFLLSLFVWLATVFLLNIYVDQQVTATDWQMAEKMCAQDKGVKLVWADASVNLAVVCNSGLRLTVVVMPK